MPDEKKGYGEQFEGVWEGMKQKGGCMGPFESPMGHGIVIKAGDEYNEDTTEYHHFLTHDAEGKALKKPRHFVQREHKPMKMEKEGKAGNMKGM